MGKRIVNSPASLDLKTLVLVSVDVSLSFETEEIIACENFDAFFGRVDVQNAYESEWKPDYYRPYYKCVYNAVTGA